MRVLVTGFGPFRSAESNPSEHLARELSAEARVLEVSFAAIDEFLDERPSFDLLLLLGLAANAERVRLETTAHNWVGTEPDVRGVVGGPGLIDPKLPAQLAASAFHVPEFFHEDDAWEISTDPGTYLCNYSLFRAIATFPDRLVGFVHVPSVRTQPLGEVSQVLGRVLRLISESN